MRPDEVAAQPQDPAHAHLLVPVLLFLPAIVGGIVRASTGLSLGLSLGLGAVGAAVMAWFARPALGRSSGVLWALGGAALAATIAVCALEVRAFEGLPSVGGGDAGNHLGLARAFDTHAPKAYFQFVVFYAFLGLVRRLTGSGWLEALRLSWNVLLATLAWLAFTFAWIGARAARPPLRAALALVITLAVAGTTWLPLVGYEQADGFYSHLAGLTVVTLALACVAIPASPAVRLLALAVTPVVLRFTYGLNLADVLAAVAILLWSEARSSPSRRRRMAVRTLGVGCIAAAVVAGRALWQLRRADGALVHPVQLAFLAALGCLVAALAVALRAQESGTRHRVLRACLALAGTTAAIQVLLALLGDGQRYYAVKHGAQALLLGLLGAGVVLAGASRRSRGAVALAVAGIVLARFSVQPWWLAYRERLRGTPTWRALLPLYDPDARTRIHEVLGTEHRAFGGFLDPSWPLTNAMNADLGFPGDWTVWDVGQRQFDEGRTNPGADSCIFWSDAPPDEGAYGRLVGGFGSGTARSWARARALPGVRCADYRARWDGRTPRRLCWHCGTGGK